MRARRLRKDSPFPSLLEEKQRAPKPQRGEAFPATAEPELDLTAVQSHHLLKSVHVGSPCALGPLDWGSPGGFPMAAARPMGLIVRLISGPRRAPDGRPVVVGSTQAGGEVLGTCVGVLDGRVL